MTPADEDERKCAPCSIEALQEDRRTQTERVQIGDDASQRQCWREVQELSCARKGIDPETKVSRQFDQDIARVLLTETIDRFRSALRTAALCRPFVVS
jgi:hypothetical protein